MASTRLLVLGVVRFFQPVHGYDVRRELLSWRVDQWANVAPGSIYNALKSMTRDGLLEVVGTDQVGGRPERTTYRLTADGENEFQALLRDTLWRVIPSLDPLMPALCFMPVMRREELMAALKHRITQIEGMVEHAEFAIAQLPNAATPEHVKELYRLSAARVAAEIPWAQALMERLERGEYQIPHPGELPITRAHRSNLARSAARRAQGGIGEARPARPRARGTKRT
ncbi:MAG TPA: PadR family transcriptional regulator [Polyangia bacterium]|jgi:DNA-binding PadR family transcriptional regulator|nr:PadR family transcriptional regulator [Polyangia bacterium]